MSDGISSPGISRQGPDDAALGLSLPAEIAVQIVEHALNGYPAEVCGLVAGRNGVAIAAYSGRNISPTPAVTYELDHDTLARIIEFEDAGLELVAIYHSHPRGPATLSPTDIARACYPDSIYLVISLATPERPELMGYRIGLTATEQVKVEIE